jgi:hypothetical protein
MNVDHYSLLGIKRNASAEDIQRAYRNLAFQHHPDRNASPDSGSRMVAINRAYETLRDAQLRREYDDRMSRAIPDTEMSAAILLAARDVISRSGWHVVQDCGRNLLVESGKNRVRIVFADRLDAALMSRAAREYPELTVVLVVFVDPSLDPATFWPFPAAIAVDLMRGTLYGEIPEGPCRTLLAPFL